MVKKKEEFVVHSCVNCKQKCVWRGKSGWHFCSNEGKYFRLTWWPETPPLSVSCVGMALGGGVRVCVCVCERERERERECVCWGGYRPHTVDLCETLPMQPDWMDSFYTCVNLGASPALRPRLSDPWPSPLTSAGFSREVVFARHVLMGEAKTHTVRILV